MSLAVPAAAAASTAPVVDGGLDDAAAQAVGQAPGSTALGAFAAPAAVPTASVPAATAVTVRVDATAASAPAGVAGSASAVAAPRALGTAHAGTAPAVSSSSPATIGSVGGAVFALALVIGLIFLLGWIAKRMPGLGGSTNPGLRVVATLALGPRERVVVVQVGETQLLLSTGAGGTRTLHTLPEPLPAAPAATPAFQQLLAQHFRKKA